jgi:hypothetical protein
VPELPPTTPGMSEHPWMEHDTTGHRAQLPDIDYWRANGWHPVDCPNAEVDRTKDPEPAAPSTGDVDEVDTEDTTTDTNESKGA